MKYSVALLLAGHVMAQDAITLNQPVSRELAAGTTESYSIRLSAGDFVSGSISQQGRAQINLYLPGGSLLRRFPSPPADGKRQLSFVAEAAGMYRIELLAVGQSANYELVLNEVVAVDDRLKPESWRDPNPSPRIEALRKQVAAGEFNAETFWRQAAQEGTPVVEPSGTDGKFQLVTFLWRGGPETRNVLVTGSFRTSSRPDDTLMHRIGDSDIWYLTLKLPAGARFSYRLSPNDPLAFDGGPRAAQRSATVQADPLNSRRWGCLPNASKYACETAAELPGAAAQPWLVKKEGTPEGKLERHQIKSEIQKFERGVAVYTPPNYRPDGPANTLLVLFDGESYSSDETRAQTTVDNLIAAGKIQPTVAILVNTGGQRRLQDLVPNQEFADFCAKELVPWVRARYNVTSSAAQTVLGGFSAGGLAAADIALRYPDVFGNVLSQSGAFWWAPDHYEMQDTTTEPNWVAKQYVTRPKVAVKFYLDAGTFEGDSLGTGGGILEGSRQLRDILLAKGYEVHYQQFVGGHDGLSWRGTLADGLIALLGSK